MSKELVELPVTGVWYVKGVIPSILVQYENPSGKPGFRKSELGSRFYNDLASLLGIPADKSEASVHVIGASLVGKALVCFRVGKLAAQEFLSLSIREHKDSVKKPWNEAHFKKPLKYVIDTYVVNSQIELKVVEKPKWKVRKV